jgi:methylenetetrahydrofolate dehydrogenase (NADP+)/methenyltetrahydrofolate cyclohydrolase
MKILETLTSDLTGKKAVIVGRSNIVGKPIALLLLAKNATVTICHSKTNNLADEVRQADIVIAAVGQAKLITADMIKPGAWVIDVGINRPAGGKICGDVDFDAVKDVAGAITPVPGGVGPLTIACLLLNTWNAHKLLRVK